MARTVPTARTVLTANQPMNCGLNMSLPECPILMIPPSSGTRRRLLRPISSGSLPDRTGLMDSFPTLGTMATGSSATRTQESLPEVKTARTELTARTEPTARTAFLPMSPGLRWLSSLPEMENLLPMPLEGSTQSRISLCRISSYS